jgi:gliding motility-associated-like protein
LIENRIGNNRLFKKESKVGFLLYYTEPENLISAIVDIISYFNSVSGRLVRRGVRRLLLSAGCWLLVAGSVTFGQTNYYSKSAGNLNVLATWGPNPDGSGTSPLNFTSANRIFNIRNNAAPTIGGDWTVSGAGSRVIIGDGTTVCVFSVPNPRDFNATTDISNNGTLRITSNAATPYSGTLTVNSGGTYEHAVDGGTIPDATWNASSNCNITGVTGNVPDGLSQSFGNFTWNCPGQNVLGLNINPISVSFSGAVTGDFTVVSTGTGSIRLSNITPRVLDISGDFNISGGIFDMAINSGSGTLNIGGDFNMTGGAIIETGFSSGLIVFDNVGTTQNFRRTVGTITGNIGFTVKTNVTIDFGANDYANGGGTFTLQSGATLQTARPAGVNGSIQTSSRSLSTSANYTFDGTSAQVTGTFLPATVNNFSINNANGISLTNIVTAAAGTLYMNSGNINTGANTFILSNPVSSALNYTAGIIIGRFERFINTTSINYLFPVGTTAQIHSITANFVNLTAGSLLVQYIAGDPGNSGLPLTDGDGSRITNQFTSGYWSALAKNSLASTNYRIDLEATGFGPYTINAGTRVIKRTDAGGSWLLNGTHSDAVGTVVKRTGMSGIYNSGGGTQFGIGRSGPGILTQPTNQTLCENAGTSFSVTASGYPTLIYQWYKAPNTPLTEGGRFTGTNLSAVNIASVVLSDAGNYYCIVTDGHGNTVQSTNGILTVNALPASPTITAGGPTTFCTGGSVTLTSSAGSTYLWSTGATTASINVTTSGSYTVRITNVSGCQSTASVATVVTVNALPATPTITAGGPITFCAGGSVTLTSSAGSTYLWSTGATTASINVTTAGSYTVRVTNASGCQSAVSATTAVTVNALPATPAISAGGTTTFCAGGSVTLTSGAGTSYLWSNAATTQSINVTTSGSYTVQVTNASGCQSAASAATVVTVNALPVTPTISDGGPTTFCAGSNVTLTSSAGTNYLWSNSATTQSINVTATGSYSVQVTDANGCQSAASVATVVTVNALPATPTITAGGPTTFCTGGSVTLTSGSETSYLWSNAETTQNINVTTAGSYTVQVTNASGCQSALSAATVVNVNALPVVNAGTDVTIPNGTSTTINATVTGTSPFTYNWSPSSQLVDASLEDPATVNLSATTVFTLMATSTVTSCSNTDAVTITISGGPLSSTPTAAPGTICAGTNIQLDAVASGGSGSYTYTWTSTPVGFTSSIANPTANPTVNTTYYVTVNDGFNTVNTQVAVTVNDLPATPVITAGGPTTFCAGGSITLTSSAGTSFLWSTGATTASINVTTSGSYTVRVTNISGCRSAISPATVVTVNSLPARPTITAGGPKTFCAGGSVTLTSSAGTSYLWSTGATTPIISVTTSGSYTVKVTNASGCQSAASVATVVTVNALPATPTVTASGPLTFCAGGSVTLTSSAGSTYLWSTGATAASINVTTSGSYTVRVTNASGCQSATSTATVVTVNALPAAPTITAGGPTTFCAGGNVTLTSSAGTKYLWSNADTTQSINVTTTGSYTVKVTNVSGCQSVVSAATLVTVNTLPATPAIVADGPTTFCTGGSVVLTSSAGASYLWSTGAITPSINVTTAGSYTVRVTNISGCQSAVSVATIVTVNALPVTPAIVADGPTTFCAGDSVTLTSGAGAGYLWSTGATTARINVTTAGSYTVKVMNASGCQSATSAATIVTVKALPATPTIAVGGPTTFCTGSSVNLTSGAGTSYLWSNGATSASINVSATGNYSVQVTNASGCQSAASPATTVTVNDLPATPTITESGPTTFCAGGSVTLTSGSGTSYLWSNGAITQSINVTAAGSYTVQVTNASGCLSAAASATVVTVYALPAIPIITGGPTTFCSGDSVTLTSSAGISYLWSNAETTESINVKAAGSYTVQVTNTNGCKSPASAATVVTVKALPVATAGSNSPVCAGSALNLTGGAAGMTNYSWTGPGGFTSLLQNPSVSASANLAMAGIYTLTVTNAGECTSTATTAVTVNSLPVATAGNNSPVCAGSALNLTGGAAGMTIYSWAGPGGFTSLLQNPSVSANATLAMAGIYTLTVTNASGCTIAAITTVTVNALPVATANNNGPVCTGVALILTGGPAGMTSYSWTGPGGFTSNTQSPTLSTSAAPAMSGVYSLTVTNANGCTNTSTTTVTINALPLVNITSSSSSMCLNDLRTLTGNPAGGTFIISSGPGTITGNVLTATGTGNIKLDYNYTNICSNKATQSIIVTEKPIATAGPDQELTFVFETQMKAELSTSETGEWSLISGSGHISDVHSPTSKVTELSFGESIFLWKVRNGNCEDSKEVKITVYDLFVPSVITPDGDGKNDYFKISENIGQVEMIIFNRWGIEEYTNGNYLNDWDGRNNKGAELPPDTYFYVLRFQDGKIKRGSVLIKR